MTHRDLDLPPQAQMAVNDPAKAMMPLAQSGKSGGMFSRHKLALKSL
jgi:hypothetical protein